MGLVIFLVVLGLPAAAAGMAHNLLVAPGERSEEAWLDVDVPLTRRTDLVPNVVKRTYCELDRPEGRQVRTVSFPGRA